jgi:hypothetical protein
MVRGDNQNRKRDSEEMKFKQLSLGKKLTFTVLSAALLVEAAGVARAGGSGTFFNKAYVMTYDTDNYVSKSDPDQNGSCIYTRPTDRCDPGGMALLFGEGCWEIPNSHHLTWKRNAYAGRPCASGPIYAGTPIGKHATPATGTPIEGGV